MMDVCLQLEGIWRSGNNQLVESQVIAETEHLLSRTSLVEQCNSQSMYLSCDTYSQDVATFDGGR